MDTGYIDDNPHPECSGLSLALRTPPIGAIVLVGTRDLPHIFDEVPGAVDRMRHVPVTVPGLNKSTVTKVQGARCMHSLMSCY